MNPTERIVADYQGTSVTIGRHPMAYRRAEMNQLGVIPAPDLASFRNRAPMKVAGNVIVRQRPGKAKGTVFLSLEDETGIANIVVMPDKFEAFRLTLLSQQSAGSRELPVAARRVRPGMRLVRGAFLLRCCCSSILNSEQCSFNEQIAFPTALFAGLNFCSAEKPGRNASGSHVRLARSTQLEAIDL